MAAQPFGVRRRHLICVRSGAQSLVSLAIVLPPGVAARRRRLTWYNDVMNVSGSAVQRLCRTVILRLVSAYAV